jgi:hypothetical protein
MSDFETVGSHIVASLKNRLGPAAGRVTCIVPPESCGALVTGVQEAGEKRFVADQSE